MDSEPNGCTLQHQPGRDAAAEWGGVRGAHAKSRGKDDRDTGDSGLDRDGVHNAAFGRVRRVAGYGILRRTGGEQMRFKCGIYLDFLLMFV